MKYYGKALKQYGKSIISGSVIFILWVALWLAVFYAM